VADRDFIDQLDLIWRSTAALGRELDESEWATPTDCPGWTVKDQLSHVVGTESALLRRPGPPPAASGLDHVRNPIGEMNEAWVEARRPQPGPTVLAEFEEVTAARLAALRAMTDEQLAEVGPSPIGQVPYATFMDVRVMDCWVHEQDMRRALDRPGHLDGPAAAAALRRLAGTLGYVVGKRLAPPDGSAIAIELTGPLARTLVVSVTGGRAAVSDATGPPPEATVCVTLPAETFAYLVAGRRRAEQALASGGATVSGDVVLGRRLLDNLATIP
jgi:uncharacterized protein (TIGR03083 family)